MKRTEKMRLINEIALILQERYTFREIDVFLSEFKVRLPENIEVNSKRVYSSSALGGLSDDLVLQIASDLGLRPNMELPIGLPVLWADTQNKFKLFISHMAEQKLKATRLKECLVDYGIVSFVAHEDIAPTLEWQTEIEKALQTMDAMVAVHTEGFKTKFWCQQEIGFALGRGTKLISLRMGEDPAGFISKHQALTRGKKTAEAISSDIVSLLESDERTKEKIFLAKPKSVPADYNDDIPF